MRFHAIGLGLLALSVAMPASAQEVTYRRVQDPIQEIRDAGIGLTVGGGVTGLTQNEGNDQINTGGQWEVRGIWGTRKVLAGEAAYVGTARSFDDGSGAGDDATLISNGGEAAIRAQLPVEFGMADQGLIAPYAVAGLNYSNYQVINEDAGSFADDDDNNLAVPLGGGVSAAYGGFLFDTRVIYRPVIDEDLLAGGDDDGLNNLAWTASVGVEF